MKQQKTCFWVAVEMALALGLPVFSSESGLNFEYGELPISTRLLANDELVEVEVVGGEMVVSGDNINGVFGDSPLSAGL